MSNKQTGGFLENFYFGMYPGLATTGYHVPYPDVHPSVYGAMPNVMTETYKAMYPWAYELEHTVIPGNQYFSSRTGEVIAEDYPLFISSFPSGSGTFRNSEKLNDKGKEFFNKDYDKEYTDKSILLIENHYDYAGNKDDMPVIILFRNDKNEKIYMTYKGENFDELKENTKNKLLIGNENTNNNIINIIIGGTQFDRSALKKSEGKYVGSVRIYISDFLNHYNDSKEMNVKTTKNSDVKIAKDSADLIMKHLKSAITINDNKIILNNN